MPDTVDTVLWATEVGWRYHPKYVEQFADKTVYCCSLLDNYWHVLHDARTKEYKDEIIWGNNKYTNIDL